VARGYEHIVGRGLQDETLKDVTSNLNDDLKDEALSVFLESVNEGLSIKECIVRVQDEVLHKVPKERNKWFIQFVYDNQLQIEIGVNMFKNGNSQFYHGLGLHDPEKKEHECPLAEWTPCACRNEEKRQRNEVMKELLDRGEIPRVTLKNQVTNDRSQPWIGDQNLPPSAPPNPTNLQNIRSLESWDLPNSCLVRQRSLQSPEGRSRGRSLDRRQGRARNNERSSSRERSVSAMGEKTLRGLGDCFRSVKPSQDRLKETEKMAWARKKNKGEEGTFALERADARQIMKNVKLKGQSEATEHKPIETEQRKITKIVFHPEKNKNAQIGSNKSPKTGEQISALPPKPDQQKDEHWIKKCLEMDNVNREKIDEKGNEKTSKEIHKIPLENTMDNFYRIQLEQNSRETEQSKGDEDLKEGNVVITDIDDDDEEDARHYIICTQSSQCGLYNMVQDLTCEESSQIKHKEEVHDFTVIGEMVNGELFTIQEETSRDEFDALFEALLDTSESEDDKDGYISNHVKNREDVELQKPVFSKTFTKSPVHMWAKIEERNNDVMKIDERREVHSFFSKPFSPEAVQTWKEGILNNNSFPANLVEQKGSRQL